jgi:hypothetical protein
LSPSELLSTSSVIRKVIFEFLSYLAGGADPLRRLWREIEEVCSRQSAREEVKPEVKAGSLARISRKRMADFVGRAQGPLFCSNLIGGYRKTEIFRKGTCSHKRHSYTPRQPQILLELYRYYYIHTAIPDRLLEEVSAYVAMAYVMARSGCHNTKKNFFVS